MEDKEYLISLARKFAYEHKAVNRIYNNYINDKGLLCFDVDIKVNLPSSFKKNGQTNKGVKSIERVVLEFPNEFPFKSPQVYLRDDFNKNFAHINPIIEKFNPCIFEGSLNELIQQPLWMDGILDQLVDWLETAASDSMINPNQGWEPMRVDDNNGIVVYDREFFINKHVLKKEFTSNVFYSETNNFLMARVTETEKEIDKFDNSIMLSFYSGVVSSEYMPNNIKKFIDLEDFAQKNNITNFKGSVNKNFLELKKQNVKLLFIAFFIKRPYTVIGSNSDIEILNFTLELKQHGKTNEVYPNANVNILSGLNFSDTKLLQQFSGAKNTIKETQTITQIGCGSLGSKIVMHLARNGNDNFILVDNKYFVPNNNARHALFSSSSIFKKVEILQKAMFELGLKNIQIEDKNIFDIVSIGTSSEDIIIDSTASISVNNFLTKQAFRGRLIHTSLYHNGTIAFIGMEGKDRKVKIIDMIAYMYHLCTEDKEIAKKITDTHASYQSIGQGCGSFTTICSDATISISSAGMSNLIQNKIDNGFSDNGELALGQMVQNNLGMTWNIKHFEPLETRTIKGVQDENWEIRIFKHVLESIKEESLKWNDLETGGILIGHISIPTQTIVVTGQLEAPEDSERGRTKFSSGVKGLSQKIQEIEHLSAMMITQLGTWHSHPNSSSSPSFIDLSSKKQMYKDRNNMPTVCLIWSHSGPTVY
jgi:integrative and conjugative element protein (TIGR02256 family)